MTGTDDTEFGLGPGIIPAPRRAAAGGHAGLSSAEQLREVFALDSLRDDEKLGDVEPGRRDRRGPFSD